MLRHPASIAGWIIAIFGIFLIMTWVPTSQSSSLYGIRSDPVFNMHKAQIANAVMFFGLFMALAGTIMSAAEEVSANRAKSVAAAEDPQGSFVEDAEESEAADAEARDETVVIATDRQGNKRPIAISDDGTATLMTLTGKKSFKSLDQAKAYLE